MVAGKVLHAMDTIADVHPSMLCGNTAQIIQNELLLL